MLSWRDRVEPRHIHRTRQCGAFCAAHHHLHTSRSSRHAHAHTGASGQAGPGGHVPDVPHNVGDGGGPHRAGRAPQRLLPQADEGDRSAVPGAGGRLRRTHLLRGHRTERGGGAERGPRGAAGGGAAASRRLLARLPPLQSLRLQGARGPHHLHRGGNAEQRAGCCAGDATLLPLDGRPVRHQRHLPLVHWLASGRPLAPAGRCRCEEQDRGSRVHVRLK
mmetsp:Transcript_14233/g.30477  ORF Transcript_14233/g.30477 Transcript_14233/m.30477 type:complete len:220 (+) Transcript_14233:689-1348(+)